MLRKSQIEHALSSRPRESRRKTAVTRHDAPPIYVISGGVGASGEQLVQTALAQFPENRVPVITVGNVHHIEQLRRVVKQAKEAEGTIAHTLVDERLRNALIDLAHQQHVVAIDLMGPLLDRLAAVLDQAPLQQPGLYRQFHRAYFERVTAIEFMMQHDDGQNSRGWPQADILLLGVSRTGKTPLSVYLSTLGWKVANLPLVPQVPVPPALAKIDRRRVIGLTIDPDQLIMYREQRFNSLGTLPPSDYIDLDKVREEVRAALRIYRDGGFAVINITGKPIETSADEIVKLITQQTKSGRSRSTP